MLRDAGTVHEATTITYFGGYGCEIAVPYPCFFYNVLFSHPSYAFLLVSLCSPGVLGEGSPSGVWPFSNSGGMIILVFLCRILECTIFRWAIPVVVFQSQVIDEISQTKLDKVLFT